MSWTSGQFIQQKPKPNSDTPPINKVTHFIFKVQYIPVIHRTSICVKDSSNPLPHGPAVTLDLILWNGRPYFHQCSPQLLRSLWGVYTLPNVHAQEIAHIFDTDGYERVHIFFSPMGGMLKLGSRGYEWTHTISGDITKFGDSVTIW